MYRLSSLLGFFFLGGILVDIPVRLPSRLFHQLVCITSTNSLSLCGYCYLHNPFIKYYQYIKIVIVRLPHTILRWKIIFTKRLLEVCWYIAIDNNAPIIGYRCHLHHSLSKLLCLFSLVWYYHIYYIISLLARGRGAFSFPKNI